MPVKRVIKVDFALAQQWKENEREVFNCYNKVELLYSVSQQE
jgi:hypothetical protein